MNDIDPGVYAVLERRKAIQTLLTIYRNPDKRKTRYALRPNGTLDKAVRKRIEELEDIGLLEFTPHGKQTCVRTSPYGMLVARGLENIGYYLKG